MQLFHRKKPRRVSADIFRPLRRVGTSGESARDPYERLLVLAAFAVVATLLVAESGQRSSSLVGLILLAIGVVYLGGRYFLKFQPTTIRDLRTLFGTLLLGAGVLLVARVVRESPGLPALLVPLPLVSLILALLLSPRFAIEATAVLSVYVLFVLWGMDDLVPLLLILLAGSWTGALYSLRVRKPSRLLFIGFLMGCTQAMVSAAVSLFREDVPPQPVLWKELSLCLGLGIATGFVVLGILPLCERLLNRISEISLLDYANPNEQPVLRRLQIEAPGTYHHSVIVAQLAEVAAEAIGANGLLCRVGCYFHDIGKMNKPEYFAENDQGARALHASLKPEMSRLIITAHVRDGVEIAEHHGLPEPIQAFIEEHHGTTAVEYFYRLAKKQRPDDDIPRDDYRYPGPKPQTKETAIAMIADSVDASSRSLEHPTPANLEKLVDSIVEMKMEDDQFDECNLTMRELTQVKEAMVTKLQGIFHNRPVYPADQRESFPLTGAEGDFLPDLELRPDAEAKPDDLDEKAG